MESAGDCEKIRMKRLFKRITALASAAALYLTDEYFENWYQSLCTKLSAYEG